MPTAWGDAKVFFDEPCFESTKRAMAMSSFAMIATNLLEVGILSATPVEANLTLACETTCSESPTMSFSLPWRPSRGH